MVLEILVCPAFMQYRASVLQYDGIANQREMRGVMDEIKVMIVDDQPVVRQGLASFLLAVPGLKLVGKQRW